MPSAGFQVPIVLLIFKRPALTARLLERIRAVRPNRLFVVADGPRPGRTDEAAQCSAAREMIIRGVDWPCQVIRDYADRNLGCAERVASGITRVFAQTEQAIILEDDCLPDPSFFPFCADLLDRYREDERIGQIGGCTFRLGTPGDGSSYYFSRYPHSWGWATWRQKWARYDHEMTAWSSSSTRQRILSDIGDAAEREYWRHAFAGTYAGRIDSWAYRWTLTCFSHGWLAAVAAQNLISNLGFAPGATHTHEVTSIAELPTRSLEFPLRHPSAVERDPLADAETSKRCFRRAPFWQRLRRRLRRL